MNATKVPLPRDPQGEAPERADRWVRWGVIGAVVAFTGLVFIWMLSVPLFLPFDENGHVAYGMALMRGHLPAAGSRLHHDFPQLGQHVRFMFVGNHPPLFYAISGPIEWVGWRLGHPHVFLLLTRGLNAVFTAINVVLVAWLAWLVVPSRSPKARATLTVLAAGLTATIPSLVSSAGSIYNDALALVIASALFVVLAKAVRGGVTTTRLVLLAVLSMLGMLTRLAFLPVFATAAGGVLLLTLWPGLRRRRPTLRDLRIGILRGAIIVLVTAAGSGWFYYLNWQRYGDLTGGSVLYPLVANRHYAPGAQQGILHFATRPVTIWRQLLQVGGLPHRFLGNPMELVTVLAIIISAALVLAALGSVVRVAGRQALLDGAGRWILLGLLLVLFAAYIEFAQHVVQKGGANNRYLLTGLVGWSIGAGLLTFGIRWRGVPVLGVVLIACCAIGSVAFSWRFTRRQPHLRHLGWWDVLVGGMRGVGVPAPQVVLAALLALVVVGFAVMVAALVAIGRSASGEAAADGVRRDATTRPGEPGGESLAVGAVK